MKIIVVMTALCVSLFLILFGAYIQDTTALKITGEAMIISGVAFPLAGLLSYAAYLDLKGR